MNLLSAAVSGGRSTRGLLRTAGAELARAAARLRPPARSRMGIRRADAHPDAPPRPPLMAQELDRVLHTTLEDRSWATDADARPSSRALSSLALARERIIAVPVPPPAIG